MTTSNRIVLGISGASGAIYAIRLLEQLVAAEKQVHLVVSPPGRRLLAEEVGIRTLTDQALLGKSTNLLKIYPFDDIGASIASGSFLTDGMVVAPCSSNTLAAVAAGLGDNLLARAAAVTLKERRQLLLLTREMPHSALELENALRLTHAGATICPASPGFYLHPKSIDELVDFVVGKLLDLLKIEHALNTRWKG